jgi:putative Mg2+ transporter-C (MgtC) family protein
MNLEAVDVLKLLLAVLAGGIIGAEREYRDKAAGFRTLIFICVGATLFTIISLKVGGPGDPVRIAANVVTGIGFLGAGVIFREPGQVTGLTTAAIIWLAAGLGMGIGSGQYALSGVATVAGLLVLWVFPRLETWIDAARHTCIYTVVCPASLETSGELDALFRASMQRVRRMTWTKSGGRMICKWEARGLPRQHEALVKKLFDRPDIEEFHV